MNSIIADIGFLLYSIPAAFLLLFVHENFRNFVLSKLHGADSHGALQKIDPICLVSLSFWGISSSGVNQTGRNDSIISYLLSQLFFLAWILVLALYTYLKQPEAESYLHLFLKTSARQSFAIFLWNWVPLPPLSASFFFWQRFYNLSHYQPITAVFRILFLIIMMLLPAGDYWWRGAGIDSLIGL